MSPSRSDTTSFTIDDMNAGMVKAFLSFLRTAFGFSSTIDPKTLQLHVKAFYDTLKTEPPTMVDSEMKLDEILFRALKRKALVAQREGRITHIIDACTNLSIDLINNAICQAASSNHG